MRSCMLLALLVFVGGCDQTPVRISGANVKPVDARPANDLTPSPPCAAVDEELIRSRAAALLGPIMDRITLSGDWRRTQEALRDDAPPEPRSGLAPILGLDEAISRAITAEKVAPGGLTLPSWAVQLRCFRPNPDRPNDSEDYDTGRYFKAMRDAYKELESMARDLLISRASPEDADELASAWKLLDQERAIQSPRYNSARQELLEIRGREILEKYPRRTP